MNHSISKLYSGIRTNHGLRRLQVPVQYLKHMALEKRTFSIGGDADTANTGMVITRLVFVKGLINAQRTYGNSD